jgi:hypothetical protein
MTALCLGHCRGIFFPSLVVGQVLAGEFGVEGQCKFLDYDKGRLVGIDSRRERNSGNQVSYSR